MTTEALTPGTDPTEAKFSMREALSDDLPPTETAEDIRAREWREVYEHFSSNATTLSIHYAEVDPVLKFELPPADEQAYEEFLSMARTRPTVQARLESLRDEAEKLYEIVKVLEKEAPELLVGKLPGDQEDLLGNDDYTLGVNQTRARTVDDAQAYLDENGGVVVGNYSLHQRFQMGNEKAATEQPEYMRRILASGYTGNPDIFRFIAAFPMDAYYRTTSERSTVVDPNFALMDGVLPSDQVIENGEGQETVSSKYIAGFIDDKGHYHRNKNFAQTDVFEVAEPHTNNEQ